VAPVRRRSRSTTVETTPGHLERSDRWNGLRDGDPVRVAGIAMRGAHWEFRAHVRNVRNGHESIEVVGGRDGDRTIRSFSPERIYPIATRAATGAGGHRRDLPPLVDAPQLPLG
jgi:hypothetical protein